MEMDLNGGAKLMDGWMGRTYEFTDDALVDEDGDGDAEDTNEGEVAASPSEIELQILSGSAPILYELVLVCFHSSPHPSIRFYLIRFQRNSTRSPLLSSPLLLHSALLLLSSPLLSLPSLLGLSNSSSCVKCKWA